MLASRHGDRGQAKQVHGHADPDGRPASQPATTGRGRRRPGTPAGCIPAPESAAHAASRCPRRVRWRPAPSSGRTRALPRRPSRPARRPARNGRTHPVRRSRRAAAAQRPGRATAMAARSTARRSCLPRRSRHPRAGPPPGAPRRLPPGPLDRLPRRDHRHSQRCRDGRAVQRDGRIPGIAARPPAHLPERGRRSPTCLAMGPCTASSWNANGAGRGGSWCPP